MTVTELRSLIGRFGELKAGEVGYKKTLPGTLKDMDTRGTIWYVDTDGYGYAFKANLVDSFVVKEFEPLPTKFNGREVYYEGGRTFYKDTQKECDLKK